MFPHPRQHFFWLSVQAPWMPTIAFSFVAVTIIIIRVANQFFARISKAPPRPPRLLPIAHELGGVVSVGLTILLLYLTKPQTLQAIIHNHHGSLCANDPGHPRAGPSPLQRRELQLANDCVHFARAHGSNSGDLGVAPGQDGNPSVRLLTVAG